MNTIATIAAKINAFADQFRITPEAVEVTSYEQMGPKVRVFYKLNRTIGKTPEQIAKMVQKIRLLEELIPDPFAEDAEPVDPETPETPEVPVTTFNVAGPASIMVGANFSPQPLFEPANATDKTFTVTANPTGIVDILNGGTTIVGLKAGTTLITYKANGGDVPEVSSTLTVEAPVKLPTSLTATFAKTEVVVGETFQPTVVVSPTDATDKTYKLNTSDASVISVDGTTYTAKKAGTATLSVAATADTNVKSTTTVVTVAVPVVVPTSATLTTTATEYTVDETFTPTVTVLPANATDKTYKLNTSDATVIAVVGNNFVCKKAGTATVSATTTSGAVVSPTVSIKVNALVDPEG